MFVFCIGSVHLFTESFVSCLLPYYSSFWRQGNYQCQSLPSTGFSRWRRFVIFQFYSMVQHFLPFQYVTVAVFRAFWYFLYLLTIADSEIGKKKHEADLKQTRRDRLIVKKKVGNYDKFLPVPTSQNDYQCFGNMDDSRLQFGCQIFIILLVVRYRSIQKRLIFGSLADTEFRSGKIRKFQSCPQLPNNVYGFRRQSCVVLCRTQKMNFGRLILRSL